MPVSKAKLRNVMKTAALDAEEHRGRIDAVIAAHKRKSSGNSGIGIEDGIVREGAMTSYGSGCLETDPLIAKESGNDGGGGGDGGSSGGGGSRGSRGSGGETANVPGEGKGAGGAPYGIFLPFVGKVSTV